MHWLRIIFAAEHRWPKRKKWIMQITRHLQAALANLVILLMAAGYSPQITHAATGSPPPSWWPADGFGTNGYRASGVAVSPFALVLGPLSSNSPSTTPAVWIATSYTTA